MSREVPNLDPPPGCSCHPDDRPPECQREHGTTHCQLAWSRKELTRLRAENERLREALGCQAEVTAVGERSSNTACSLQTDLSAEAVEAIVTGVMDECSVNMHKCFATGKDDMAEAFRLRLEGAARVAQKLGMLRPDEEPASAMSAHRESHHSPDTEDETPGGSQNPVSEPLP